MTDAELSVWLADREPFDSTSNRKPYFSWWVDYPPAIPTDPSSWGLSQLPPVLFDGLRGFVRRDANSKTYSTHQAALDALSAACAMDTQDS